MNHKQSILKHYWGHEQFRPLQEDIIDCALTGKDSIALLPTGGGKSICYQIPALMLEGLCLVVSPLISLMQDQVQQLQAMSIEASFLHSGLSNEETEDLLFAAKNGAYKLLYVAPERLQNKQFIDWCPYLNINLIAVDEAHCVSQWGHDFRPEYLQIAQFRKNLKNAIPIMALTASATQAVLADIQKQLGMKQASIFRQSFHRANIYYRVRFSENKLQEIVHHFQTHPQCGIVYCRSRKKTEELSSTLQQYGINAQAYHAGMPRQKRFKAQEDWMTGNAMVMVATTAFGMGINKADVRSVVHWEPAEQLEAFYQETGRAGRDGQPAHSLCLYNHKDIFKLEQSTELYYPPAPYLRKVYQAVCDYLQIPIGCEPDDYYDFDLAQFINYFKLEAIPASHALRILGQEGLWTISESLFRPASVLFLSDRNLIDEIGRQFPTLGLVATALLRLYSGIFHQACIIHPFHIAQHLKLRKEDVQLALQQLHQLNIIEFKATKECAQIHFHHYRVDSKHLLLNIERINRLRTHHQERTKAMIDFLQHQDNCRNQAMLAYFGERSGPYCGHCDVCSAKKIVHEQFNLFKEIQQLLDHKDALSLQEISEKLNVPTKILSPIVRKLLDEQKIKLNELGLIMPTKNQ